MMKEKKKLLKTHNVVRLAKEVGLPEGLAKTVALFEPVYLETRYPDVSSSLPYEEFEKEDAEERLNIAKEICEWIEKKI